MNFVSLYICGCVHDLCLNAVCTFGTSNLLCNAIALERIARGFHIYVGASCLCHSPPADTNCLTWITNHNIALTLAKQLTGGQ